MFYPIIFCYALLLFLGAYSFLMRDRKGVHGDEREGGEKLGGEEEILFIFHCMIKKSMFNKGEVCSCAFSLSSFDVKDV